ncbi:MAG: hypothetical protein A2X61_13715 [Ignavibacteria bacterium GWB2_35_12]|nr:MAG: hypothetical protein A2X63_09500 [Ignavibacteria bacterium GWA2_35_8]OGU41172.1 MAG: hypothetical protein A2X61_13715 [Ignavibacteria bacterium GWB2_35_12]OGU89119.1 MAG: hypothetical protein A2220_15455 [Ignavibacteria bacterium RIFOXYA2_FULL_35_10]OGV23094.1 MAG: hypothetical protein A2475_17045 [Ignavibacteria bacterium RIFOXYC2_FULL_35_21]
MATQKEEIAKLVNTLRTWQKIEDDSIRNSSEILKKTENPLIHLIMEIIRQDSAMHKRVQQLIIDHFEKKPISITPEELLSFWNMVEEHDEIEKKTIKLAEEAMNETTSNLARYLLEYLMTDEKKHDMLLSEMEKIKKGMYPYGGI